MNRLPILSKSLHQHLVALVTGVFLLLLIGAGRHPFSFLALEIYLVEDQKQTLICSVPVQAGQEVILSYRHSSDGTPVEQVFRAGGDRLLHLLEERYVWYGAGLEPGSGYEMVYAGGWVRITGLNRSFEALPIRVAATVPQLLQVGEKAILLSDLAPPAARLLVKVSIKHFPRDRKELAGPCR